MIKKKKHEHVSRGTKKPKRTIRGEEGGQNKKVKKRTNDVNEHLKKEGKGF